MCDMQSEIKLKNEEFQKYFASNDIQELVQRVYTETCKFMPHGVPLIQGRDGVKDVFQEERNNVADNLVLKTIEINGTTDFAYERGSYEFKKGNEIIDFGKYVVIWRKSDGEWKIDIDIFNSDKSD